MRTGFAGYVSAAHADVPAIAPAIAMQIMAIRFMIAVFLQFSFRLGLLGTIRECTGTV